MLGYRIIRSWLGVKVNAFRNRWPAVFLPKVLEYSGEFGPELVLFLPFCNWLSKEGLLKNRYIRTYRGMGCYYSALDCRGVIEKDQPRTYISAPRRPNWLPVRDEHNFDNLGRPSRHLYPDLRRQFGQLPMLPDLGSADRPLLIIHNKHNNEWNSGPVNHIPLSTLEAIFTALKRDFTIVYIRHGMSAQDQNFSDDHNSATPFDDRALLQRHPEILCFDDLFADHRAQGGSYDLNTFKNVLYSRCYRFISSQGGGTYQIALYSGSLLVVLHRRGEEEHWQYGDGNYSFMAAVPPILAICRTVDDLVRSLPLFQNTVTTEDRILLAAGSAPLLAELSPWTIAQRTA